MPSSASTRRQCLGEAADQGLRSVTAPDCRSAGSRRRHRNMKDRKEDKKKRGLKERKAQKAGYAAEEVAVGGNRAWEDGRANHAAQFYRVRGLVLVAEASRFCGTPTGPLTPTTRKEIEILQHRVPISHACIEYKSCRGSVASSHLRSP